MREYVTPANLITSCNLAAGFLALVLAGSGRLFLAAVLVVVAGVLDSVDGPVARRRASNGAFGTNLDSLADLVSFGVVPALVLYKGPFVVNPILGAIAGLGFVICGAWRLARFPLIKNPRRFTGLPIPPTGVAVALFGAWGPPMIVALVAVLAVSVLMVSSFPFPTISSLIGGASSVSRWLPPRRSSHR